MSNFKTREVRSRASAIIFVSTPPTADSTTTTSDTTITTTDHD